jgi:hypothetical protein
MQGNQRDYDPPSRHTRSHDNDMRRNAPQAESGLTENDGLLTAVALRQPEDVTPAHEDDKEQQSRTDCLCWCFTRFLAVVCVVGQPICALFVTVFAACVQYPSTPTDIVQIAVELTIAVWTLLVACCSLWLNAPDATTRKRRAGFDKWVGKLTWIVLIISIAPASVALFGGSSHGTESVILIFRMVTTITCALIAWTPERYRFLEKCRHENFETRPESKRFVQIIGKHNRRNPGDDFICYEATSATNKRVHLQPIPYFRYPREWMLDHAKFVAYGSDNWCWVDETKNALVEKSRNTSVDANRTHGQ